MDDDGINPVSGLLSVGNLTSIHLMWSTLRGDPEYIKDNLYNSQILKVQTAAGLRRRP